MQLVRITAASQRGDLRSLSNSGQSVSPFELFLIEGGNALVGLRWMKIKAYLPLQRIIFFRQCYFFTFFVKMHAECKLLSLVLVQVFQSQKGPVGENVNVQFVTPYLAIINGMIKEGEKKNVLAFLATLHLSEQ